MIRLHITLVLLGTLQNSSAAPSGHALVFDGGGTDIAAVGADLASIFSGTGGGVSVTFWMKMYYLTDGSARAFPMTMQTDMYGNLLLQPVKQVTGIVNADMLTERLLSHPA